MWPRHPEQVSDAPTVQVPRPRSKIDFEIPADQMNRIERLQQTGVRRVGAKNHFRYVAADGRKVSRVDLARIEALKIPPAWTDVAINRAAGGMLQAEGKDSAGRWE